MALVTDEGVTLYDSRVICHYLNDHQTGALYPADDLYTALTLEALGDGIMDAAVLMVYEGRCRPEEIRYPDWVEAQWAKITRALDHLETNGIADGFHIGHIALACALGYIDFRHPGRDWRGIRPAVTRWFSEISQRASIAQTRPSE